MTEVIGVDLGGTKVAAGYVLPGLGRGTNIRLARHGVGACVLGAALLAIHELHVAAAPAVAHAAAGASGAPVNQAAR